MFGPAPATPTPSTCRSPASKIRRECDSENPGIAGVFLYTGSIQLGSQPSECVFKAYAHRADGRQRISCHTGHDRNPEYRRYVVRTQFVEGVEVAGGFKASVLEWTTNEGRCPAPGDAAQLGACNAQGRCVSGVSFAGTLTDAGGCSIIATFRAGAQPALANRQVTLYQLSADGSANWSCTSDVDSESLPRNCNAR